MDRLMECCVLPFLVVAVGGTAVFWLAGRTSACRHYWVNFSARGADAGRYCAKCGKQG